MWFGQKKHINKRSSDNRRHLLKLGLFFVVISLLINVTWATTPPTSVALQTVLENSYGPLEGQKQVVIRLYSGATKQSWEEIHPSITFTQGACVIPLGANVPLTENDLNIATPSFRLIIEGEEITVTLNAVPYAIKALYSERVPETVAITQFTVSENMVIGNTSHNATITVYGITNILGSLAVSQNLLIVTNNCVGIGQTDSNYLFNVNGSANISTLYINGVPFASAQGYRNLDTISVLSTANTNIIIANGENWTVASGNAARLVLGLGTSSNVVFNQLLANQIGVNEENLLGEFFVSSTANSELTPIKLPTLIVTNNRVGIGVTEPSASLHVSGNYPLIIGSSITPNSLVISNKGNVGIGRVPSDQYKLHVSGDIKVEGQIFAQLGLSTDEDWIINTQIGQAGTVYNATDNIGIGTSSPQGRLHVAFNTYNALVATNNRVGLGTIDPQAYFHMIPPSRVLPYVFKIDQGGDEFITVRENGYIGMGTASPTTRLQITDGGYASFAVSGNRVGIGTSNISAILDIYQTETPTPSFVYIHDFNNTPILYINNSGLIGVGTSNPTGLLDVVGATGRHALMVSENRVGIGISNPEAVFDIYAGTESSIPYFRVRDSEGVKFAIGSAGGLGVGTASPVGIFQVGEEALVVTRDRVGINTVTPLGVLHVMTTENAQNLKKDTFIVTNNTIGIGTASPYENYILTIKGKVKVLGTIEQDASNHAYIDDDWVIGLPEENKIYNLQHAIGIGTSTPQGSLQIRSTDNTSLIMEDTLIVKNNMLGLGLTDPAATLHVSGNVPLRIDQKNNLYRLMISDEGLVGIATSNPRFTLDIAGSLNAKELYINGVLYNHASLVAHPNYFMVGSDTDTVWSVYTPAQARTAMGVGSSDSPTFTRIGLNTTTFSGELHIRSYDNTAETYKDTLIVTNNCVVVGDISTTSARLMVSGNTQLLVLSGIEPTNCVGVNEYGFLGIGTTAPSGNLHVMTGTRTNLIVTSNRFGIGTTSPQEMVHIQFNSGWYTDAYRLAGLLIENTTTPTDYYGSDYHAPGIKFKIQNAESAIKLIPMTALDGDLAFQVEGSEAMRISSQRYVGIGTSAPSSNLHVFVGVTENNTIFSPSGIGIGTSSPSASFHIVYSGNDTMAVTGNQVGFGLREPQSLVHISGNMVISGNQGINTLSPSGVLDIFSGTTLTRTMIVTDNMVGIGMVPVAADDAVLQINGNLRVMGALNVTAFDDGDWATSNAGSNLYMHPYNLNYNIGIGTSIPKGFLHVVTNASDTLVVTSNRIGIGLTDPAAQLNIKQASSETPILITNANGSTTYFTVTANGRIGIKTAAPDYDVDVSGTVNALSVAINGNEVATRTAGLDQLAHLSIASDNFIVGNTDAQWTTKNVTQTRTILGLATTQYPTFAGITLNTQLRISTDNDYAPIWVKASDDSYTAFVITRNGKVGIGTSEPAYRVDVVGTINATGLSISGDRVATTSASLDSLAALQIQDAGFIVGSGSLWSVKATSNARDVLELGLTDTPTFNTLTLSGLDVYTDSYHILKIADNGTKLGIGAESTLSTVYIKPEADASPLYITDTAGTAPILTVSPNGYVGINTANPTAYLDVSGTINAKEIKINGAVVATMTTVLGQLAYLSAADNDIIVGQTSTWVTKNGSTARTALGLGTSDQPTFNKVFATALDIFDNSYHMLYASGSKVGVGTTAPETVLHIASDNAAIIKLQAGSTELASQIQFNRGSGKDTYIGPSSNAFNIWSNEDMPLRFGVNNAENMTILQNGYVGIGTTSPSWELDLSKSKNGIIQAGMYNSYAQRGSALYIGASDSGVTYLMANGYTTTQYGIPSGYFGISNTYGGIAFARGSNGSATEAMRLTPSGNLGVAATDVSLATIVINPNSNAPANNALLALSNTDADASANMIFKNTQRTWNVGSDSNPDGFFIAPNLVSQNVFFISATGNVGIGTTNPTDALHVIGTINASVAIAVNDARLITSSVSLQSLSALPMTDDNFIVGTGSGWELQSGDNARSLLNLGTDSTPQFLRLGLHRAASGAELHISSGGNDNAFVVTGNTVGIGAASPNATLEIRKTGIPVLRLNNYSNVSAVTDYAGSIEFFSKDSTWGSDGAIVSKISSVPYSTEGDQYGMSVSIREKNSESLTDALVITSQGHLGVRTSSPLGRLHVTTKQNSDGAEKDTLIVTDNRVIIGTGSTLDQTDYTLYMAGKSKFTDNIQMKDIILSTTGAPQRAKFNSDLHLDGRLLIGGSSYGENYELRIKGLNNSPATLFLNDNENDKSGLRIENYYDTAGYQGNVIYPSDGSGGVSRNVALRLLTDNTDYRYDLHVPYGYIGIGTVTPSGNLHIRKLNADSSYTDSFVVTNNLIGIGTSVPSGSLHIVESNTTRLIVLNNKLGINTIAPSGALHVVESGSTEFIVLNNKVGINTEAPGAPLHVKSADGSSDYFIVTHNRIGINTTAPTGSLHIVDGSASLVVTNNTPLGLRMGINTENPTAQLTLYQATNVPGIYIDKGTTTKGDLAYPSNEDFTIGTWDGSTWTTQVTIANSGKLGIYSNNPQSLLTVSANSGTNAVHIATKINTTDSDTLFIKDGKVGIGTTRRMNGRNLIIHTELDGGTTPSASSIAIIGKAFSGYYNHNQPFGKIEFGIDTDGVYNFPARIIGLSETSNPMKDGEGNADGIGGRLDFQTAVAEDDLGDDASAPTTKMTIRGDGKVGIGTAIPNVLLHLKSGTPALMTSITNTNLKIESDNDAYISILNPSDKASGLYLGNYSGNHSGAILYNSSTALHDTLEFRLSQNITAVIITGNYDAVSFVSSYKLWINSTSAANLHNATLGVYGTAYISSDTTCNASLYVGQKIGLGAISADDFTLKPSAMTKGISILNTDGTSTRAQIGIGQAGNPAYLLLKDENGTDAIGLYAKSDASSHIYASTLSISGNIIMLPADVDKGLTLKNKAGDSNRAELKIGGGTGEPAYFTLFDGEGINSILLTTDLNTNAYISRNITIGGSGTSLDAKLAVSGNLHVSGNLCVVGTAFKTGGGTWESYSDIRLKKDIKPLENALDNLLKLKGVAYKWKNPAAHGNFSGTEMGFIAQDVQPIFPDWISTYNGYLTLNLRGYNALVVEAIRELNNENKSLRTDVAKLKEDNEALKKQIEWIMKELNNKGPKP